MIMYKDPRHVENAQDLNRNAPKSISLCHGFQVVCLLMSAEVLVPNKVLLTDGDAGVRSE